MASPKKMGFGDMQEFLNGSVAATTAQKNAAQKNVVAKLTTTQRNALTGDDLYAGLVIFNTTTSKLNFYTGAAWEAVTSA